jgi:hypothetical protein
MRLGLIIESTRDGLEFCVCPKIIRLLAAECAVSIECNDQDIAPMTNKRLLIQNAASVARSLLANGCDRIIILWDENPAWTPESRFAKDPCWHTEREQILATLNSAGVDRRRVGLVCIEREFESWLLFDSQLLSAVISSTAERISRLDRRFLTSMISCANSWQSGCD